MKLYNTLSGTLDPFTSSGELVKMYVCGVTPYSQSHVGHALRAVVFDVLRRYLEFKGYRVKHVENFTDIDDKMIQRAESMGVPTQKLAEDNISVYLSEMKALNILPAHVYPRATEEIPEIVRIIEGLIERNFAYAVGGNVYFRVRSDDDYGKLSRRSPDSMIARSRVEVDEQKEDEMDFALWKSQKPGEPSWGSPWGPGRPGWHIECSAMALSHLGFPLDIHGGGQDLIFPHHENEIAQSESYSGCRPMSRFWIHNGLVRLGGDKMSKSAGNLVTVKDALQRHSPDELRLFFLSAHYRSPLTYTEEGVAAQARAVERLRNTIAKNTSVTDGDAIDPLPFRERFVLAMDDDLNTPRAIASIFDLSRYINKAVENGRDVTMAQQNLVDMADVLGLTLSEHIDNREAEFFPLLHLLLDTYVELRSVGKQDLADGLRRKLQGQNIELADVLGKGGGKALSPDVLDLDGVGGLVNIIIESRNDLRGAGLYDLADWTRQRLGELGFVLEDASGGTEWRRR